MNKDWLLNEKEYVGKTFFHFYFTDKSAHLKTSAIIFPSFLLLISIFLYVYPTIDSNLYFLGKILTFMLVLIYFIVSLTEADNIRRRKSEKNNLIEDITLGNPVDSKKVTRKYYDLVKANLNPTDKIKVKTDIGVHSIRIDELPNNKIVFPNLTELFTSTNK